MLTEDLIINQDLGPFLFQAATAILAGHKVIRPGPTLRTKNFTGMLKMVDPIGRAVCDLEAQDGLMTVHSNRRKLSTPSFVVVVTPMYCVTIPIQDLGEPSQETMSILGTHFRTEVNEKPKKAEPKLAKL